MSECTCHKNYTLDTLIPKVGVITDIREETPDVKTFRVNAPEGGKIFEHMPGQCAMLCAPGISEGMFSITSSPTNKEYQEFSIKKCGMLTDYLHSLEVGDEITVRGPYGNHFPVEDKLKGKDLLFIAGGIGLTEMRGWYGTDGPDLVLEIDDDALRRLESYALDSLECGLVAGSDDRHEFVGRERREDHPRRVAPDARHSDEQQEQLTLLTRGEAIEHMGILADHLADEELALGLALQSCVGIE